MNNKYKQLQESLKIVLGDHVKHKGSNITPERLRFDFSHPEKLTSQELKKVEDIMNDIINKNYQVKMEKMSYKNAKKIGALFIEGEGYPEDVNV